MIILYHKCFSCSAVSGKYFYVRHKLITVMASAEHTPTFELQVMQQCCMTRYVIPHSRVCALHILRKVYIRGSPTTLKIRMLCA
jgi:DNA-directed RNA polymerase subunit N (RpoN/RPB10)